MSKSFRLSAFICVWFVFSSRSRYNRPMKIEPLTLEGQFVRLEPLSLAHHEALCVVGLDAELWRWTVTNIRTPEDMRRYIEAALAGQAAGRAAPFATIDKRTSRVVGSTRFADVDTKNRGAEIGWTWIAREWQRTHVNTEAKLLMLTHAFETWKLIRVFLKTDSLNEKSRRAILRVGAKQEGTFRNHMITYTGRIRHTVYFSVIDREWEETKRQLKEKLRA